MLWVNVIVKLKCRKFTTKTVYYLVHDLRMKCCHAKGGIYNFQTLASSGEYNVRCPDHNEVRHTARYPLTTISNRLSQLEPCLSICIISWLRISMITRGSVPLLTHFGRYYLQLNPSQISVNIVFTLRIRVSKGRVTYPWTGLSFSCQPQMVVSPHLKSLHLYKHQTFSVP